MMSIGRLSLFLTESLEWTFRWPVNFSGWLEPSSFNSFLPNVLFWFFWRFLDVFQGDRKGTLGRKGSRKFLVKFSFFLNRVILLKNRVYCICVYISTIWILQFLIRTHVTSEVSILVINIARSVKFHHNHWAANHLCKNELKEHSSSKSFSNEFFS